MAGNKNIMNKIYKCPYCLTTTSNNKKNFNSWRSVSAHSRYCSLNTNEYYCDGNEGPIHYKELENNFKNINIKYPNLICSPSDIRTVFRKRGFNLSNYKKLWNKKLILESIKSFYLKNNRVPQERDFCYTDIYPGYTTVQRYFGSWNCAIKKAGFIPTTIDLFGTPTKAKDGLIYKSILEAEFVNKWLFDKEVYIYEPKYPAPHNKYYDFYLPEKDLYLEIDGGIRPQVIKEKIEINNKLNRNLLVVKDSFQGFINVS